MALINQTFAWIEKELKDSIDFVIWTGDSARHDNDEAIPRSTEQVTRLNQLLVDKIVEVFGKPDNTNDTDPTNDLIIPVVPTFGNNDILPHNIFSAGPNVWTRRYASIWKQFIPEEQRHQFEQGGWFSVEVIPKKLAVFSLNTLYFFDSNSAVDGCSRKSEPGYRQMEWLRIQLQFLRERRMKALLIGHVPPARTESKQAWDESCWQKYTLWMRQYRDVVVGTMYGHMNIDHFIIQDFEDIKMRKMGLRDVADSNDGRTSVDGNISARVAGSYLVDLRDEWAKLPKPPPSKRSTLTGAIVEDSVSKSERATRNDRQSTTASKGRQKNREKQRRKFLEKIGGEWGERFSVSHVSPSVVPNYFPTLRVYEYNITGLEDILGDTSEDRQYGLSNAENDMSVRPPMQTSLDEDSVDLETDANTQARRRPKPKKPRFVVPDAPSKSSPPGPAYSPQTLSLLGFTQYYANLTHINNDFALSQAEPGDERDADAEKWKEGKHRGRHPKDKDHKPRPKVFEYEVEYHTRNDGVYCLKDLTMRSYIDLAQRIGSFKGGKAVRGQDADEETESAGGDEVESDSGDKAATLRPDNDDDEGNDDDDDDSSYLVTHKESDRRKKEKKHKSKQREINKAWYAFVKRAFVGTLGPDEIREQFGRE
ncbi:Endopolyphosphatase [Elasticomyces elasticus]|nr:Endopolyphosphatase [Elasticomyces elasticus]